MTKSAAEVVVVGAGPAGLAAATAASKRSRVILLDDNSAIGGQIWRAEHGKLKSTRARRWAAAIDSKRVSFLKGCTVVGSDSPNSLLVDSSAGPIEIKYEKLIVATGARERFLPFPGWTLPNVMGAGGLQAMVKGGLKITGKRVIVSGTGPLLIAVAEYLKRKGANVVAIAEQTSAARLNSFALSLFRSPAKLMQALVLRSKLLNIPYLTDCWVSSANGDDRLATVELTRRGKTSKVECDYLACGFHLVPNIECVRLLGCRIESGFVDVDHYQQTSVESVYCAGEATGIAGVESALLEGEIAGLAATGQRDESRKLFSKRDKARAFGFAVDRTFALRDELRSLALDDTFVCRCEDVEFGRLRSFDNFREAKLQTRCGMGPCQGRVCGAATQFLFGWEPPSVRPPIIPVKMEHL
jgi:NADPH-dependent 2,4-dienoyl-CoA reductase/sulfur reductase-like enzyme